MMPVLKIKPIEDVFVDHDRLITLYSRLGESGAEDVVCRAIEELALRMAQCDQYYKRQNWKDLRKNARSLIGIADQIGMQSLSIVAADVTVCIDHDDHVALAATLSRLLRLGERSLSALWELHDG